MARSSQLSTWFFPATFGARTTTAFTILVLLIMPNKSFNNDHHQHLLPADANCLVVGEKCYTSAKLHQRTAGKQPV